MIIATFLITVTGCSYKDGGRNELANKPIYADLQAIEYAHRPIKLTTPILIKGAIDSGKYDALGVPSIAARFPSVWIVINANNGDGGVLKVPDDEKIALACAYLDKLETSENIDGVVKAYLKNSCI